MTQKVLSIGGANIYTPKAEKQKWYGTNHPDAKFQWKNGNSAKNEIGENMQNLQVNGESSDEPAFEIEFEGKKISMSSSSAGFYKTAKDLVKDNPKLGSVDKVCKQINELYEEQTKKNSKANSHFDRW